MKYRTWPWIVLSVCMLFHGISRGGQLDQQHPFPFSPFELKNGLTVILAQDDTLPVVTIAVAYKVGTMHEDLDKAGLAYFLEHLMFEGSRNVSRMQHVRFIQSIGGRLNAVTERDRTIFYQTIPSHHLTSILWLESDRMTSLSINQANVDFWKSTLKSGLKMRSGQDPYQNGSRIFDALLYPDYA
ncbi:MAG: M16 family metallopeptidase, partial [Candidatus Aminicenantaceae bacterium]